MFQLCTLRDVLGYIFRWNVLKFKTGVRIGLSDPNWNMALPNTPTLQMGFFTLRGRNEGFYWFFFEWAGLKFKLGIIIGLSYPNWNMSLPSSSYPPDGFFHPLRLKRGNITFLLKKMLKVTLKSWYILKDLGLIFSKGIMFSMKILALLNSFYGNNEKRLLLC